MPSSDLAVDPSTDAPSDLIQIGTYATFTSGSERGLVALAMGFPYWLVPVDAGFALFVEPAAGQIVREQIRRYDQESMNWPPAPVVAQPGIRRIDLMWPLGWALAVLAAFWAQQAHPVLTEMGALETAAVFGRHEWWRLGAALFLHADLGHLISNTLSGLFVFSAVSGTFGVLRGWLLIAGSALLGNLLAAAGASSPGYASIGASTAIFAAVGLLTGRALHVARHARARRVPAIFAPFAAGLTVLALYGAGGQRVDVGAHLCGFIAGLALGFWSERTRRRPAAV